jgi:SAM-dependent methyltransferase
VFGVDASAYAIDEAHELARRLVPGTPPNRFRAERLEALSFEDGVFDTVLCSAVLHFADGQTHFDGMLGELWRVLAPGGLLFTRLASSIGLEDQMRPIGSGRFRLPDGTDRFLVNEAMLLAATDRLGGRLADPIKTTNVQGQRCMTTWCVWKDRS